MGLYEKVNGEWVRKQAGNSENSAAAAHYSMTTIASGTITPMSDDEAATTVSVSHEITGVTLETLRGYKAVFFQASAANALTPMSYASLNLYDGVTRNILATFKGSLKGHRAIILFADLEHYSSIVLAASSSNNYQDEQYPSLQSSSNEMSVGVVDMGAIADTAYLAFNVVGATVGNEISYQLIGISEEAANFT